MTEPKHPLTIAIVEAANKAATSFYRQHMYLQALGISSDLLHQSYVDELVYIIEEEHVSLDEDEPGISGMAVSLAETAFALRLAMLLNAAKAEPGHA